MPLISYCADIGSVPNGNFAWARVVDGRDRFDPSASADITALANAVAADLTAGSPVALGFEAPIFVPVPDEPNQLGKQRAGESGRPWSAGPGGAVLPTGIVQMAWLLRRVGTATQAARAHTSWPEFVAHGQGLFLWEAFVSHKTAPSTHYDDALAGARRFAELTADGDPTTSSAVTGNQPWLSLVGAALLWAGWTADTSVLHGSVPVIQATVGA